MRNAEVSIFQIVGVVGPGQATRPESRLSILALAQPPPLVQICTDPKPLGPLDISASKKNLFPVTGCSLDLEEAKPSFNSLGSSKAVFPPFSHAHNARSHLFTESCLLIKVIILFRIHIWQFLASHRGCKTPPDMFCELDSYKLCCY